MLRIGSHMSIAAPDYLLGAVKETINNGANALMVYTGAPQNTIRKDINLFKIEEGLKLMSENGIDQEALVIHSPYIINLGNCENDETYELAKRVLKDELKRSAAMGAKYLVLHPGSALKASHEDSIKRIAAGLNECLTPDNTVMILLETMAGKGSEVGSSFEELAAIYANVDLKDKIGVCMDTCHLNDAGYDVADFDGVLDEFANNLPLDLIKVIHVNDSKNPRGASKDRHANIGYGYIGFDALLKVINNPRIEKAIKILETPYVNKEISPYKTEIAMLKQGEFTYPFDEYLEEN